VSIYLPGCNGLTSGAWDYCYEVTPSPSMIVAATNVNKSSVNAANWSTTKSLTASLSDSSITKNIPITVTAVSTISKL
jgi:hypothetical protein